eukprot:531450-Rhodomonas_salina.4
MIAFAGWLSACRDDCRQEASDCGCWIDGRQPEGYANLARVLLMQGKGQEALQASQRAIDISPANGVNPQHDEGKLACVAAAVLMCTRCQDDGGDGRCRYGWLQGCSTTNLALRTRASGARL